MKKLLFILFVLLNLFLLAAFSYPTEKFLAPEKLAETLRNTTLKKPIIYNVGPSAMIPGAIPIGETINPANQTKFKTALKSIPTNSDIVIYCGCCKIEDCWNIHEAHTILINLGFTNFKILNLKTDFKTDWIDKKYPLQ
jgi:thiosulfate/3-mercaptopyruvate sulfurtransferase